MIPLLLACLAGGDVVHTRDGRKVEGRVLYYDDFVEVESGDPQAKPARLFRRDILKIDLAPNFIRCPEIVPFPYDQLEKGEYDYLSFRHVLIAVPRPPARKVVAIDIARGRKVWEMDFPNRTGEPVLGGRILYFIQKELAADPNKKVKVEGSLVPREIHRLVVKAVDFETGDSRWTHTFDNTDSRNLHWEFFPTPVPSVHVLADRVVIRAMKQGYPFDGVTVDKSKPQRLAAFYSYDPLQKRVVSQADSPEAAEAAGKPWFTQDSAVCVVLDPPARLKLTAVNLKDGKIRWQSDFLPQAAITDVTDEYAYVTDATHLYAWSVKTGKKLEKWAVDHQAGTIAAIDANYVYVYRTRKGSARAIAAFDVKTSKEAWKIDMPDGEEFIHALHTGHRLLFTDRANALRCWDTLTRKEAWRWTSGQPGLYVGLKLQGSAISFYKDGRVYTLDLATGQKLWEVKKRYHSILQVGDGGVVGHMLTGADVIHERAPLKGSVFFTPTGTPLRFAVGDDVWSPPSLLDGRAYCLTSGGVLAGADVQTRRVLWTQRVSSTPVMLVTPPVAYGGRVAVTLNPDTHVYELEGKTRQFIVKHTPLRPERSVDLYGDSLITMSSAGFALTQFATGEKRWDAPVRGVVAYAVDGDNLYAAAQGGMVTVDLKLGRPGAPAPLSRQVTQVAAEGGRAFASTGPYGFGESAPGSEFRMVFRSGLQNPGIAVKFRGALAAAGGHVYYAHSDGLLGCFEGGTEKTAWTFSAQGFTSPLFVHGGRVWFGAGGQGLYGLNAKTGAVEWTVEPVPDAHLFTPILWEGKVAFWSSDGWLVTTE